MSPLQSMGPEGKDPKDGSFLGSMIDEPLHSRYRFTPAEEGPGSASGRHGLTYAPTSLEENISLVSLARLHRALLLQDVQQALTCTGCLVLMTRLSACVLEDRPLAAMYLLLLLEPIKFNWSLSHLLPALCKAMRLLPDISSESREQPARLMSLLTSQSRMQTPQLLLDLLRVRVMGMRTAAIMVGCILQCLLT